MRIPSFCWPRSSCYNKYYHSFCYTYSPYITSSEPTPPSYLQEQSMHRSFTLLTFFLRSCVCGLYHHCTMVAILHHILCSLDRSKPAISQMEYLSFFTFQLLMFIFLVFRLLYMTVAAWGILHLMTYAGVAPNQMNSFFLIRSFHSCILSYNIRPDIPKS